jgi:hypothetical protein
MWETQCHTPTIWRWFMAIKMVMTWGWLSYSCVYRIEILLPTDLVVICYMFLM